MWFPCRSSGCRCSAVLAALIFAAGYAPPAVATPAIETPRTAAPGGVVAITGLPDAALKALAEARPDRGAWGALFVVRVADADVGAPNVLGDYSVADGRVVFTPRFPLVPGIGYEVRFDAGGVAAITGVDAGDVVLTARFVIDAPPVEPSTTVSTVYPSADSLPANVLRFYIYFSAPMRAGDAFANVSIVDDSSGAVVADAFVETTPELWDGDMRRLTVICHPGRIKRGLAMRERAGPPLREGGAYRLVVGDGLRDTYGLPLASQFEKHFTVMGTDRECPSPGSWRVHAPPARSRAPVRIDFGEPIDHAMASRLITIRTRDGTDVPGVPGLAEHERVWTYAPEHPWASGSYAVIVHTMLEDIAGNRVNGLFDSPAGAPAVVSEETLSIPFVIVEAD